MNTNELLEGLPNSDAVVQKSLPLFSLWHSNLTLPEFKILDLYLARINSHDPDHRTVCFEKGELERLLNVTEIKGPVLRERLRHLCIGVEMEDPSRPEGFVTIFLFEQISGGIGKDGLWKIELRCTESARKYIFNIETIGYLRYKLREIVPLRSRYSYLLFLYLEQNQFRGTWETSVEELKEVLQCENVPLYQNFKRFNERILRRAQAELSARTKFVFSYAPVRKGKRVIAVRFTVKSLDHSIELKPSSTKLLPNPNPETEFTSAQKAILAPCNREVGPTFSVAQQRQILQQLLEIPLDALPTLAGFGGQNTSSLQRQHLVARCYTKLLEQMNKKTVRDPFAYFMQILKNYAKSPLRD